MRYFSKYLLPPLWISSLFDFARLCLLLQLISVPFEHTSTRHTGLLNLLFWRSNLFPSVGNVYYLLESAEPILQANRYRFHIISNHSANLAAFGNQLDYLGIVILMWGSTIPTVYYGFYCDRNLQILYCTMVRLHALRKTPVCD